MKILMAILMWVLRLTWGLPASVIGFFVFLWSLTQHPKIGYIANTIVVEVRAKPGESGWGLQGGIFIFSNTNSIWNRDHLLYHEWGHAWPQMLATGPLQLFLVLIPSTIRFWYRELQYRNGKHDLPPYDSVWFEGTASRWGRSWFEFGARHGWWR